MLRMSVKVSLFQSSSKTPIRFESEVPFLLKKAFNLGCLNKILHFEYNILIRPMLTKHSVYCTNLDPHLFKDISYFYQGEDNLLIYYKLHDHAF